MDVHEAISRLISIQKSYSAEHACWILHEVLAGIEMIKLYRHFFPKEYEQSAASSEAGWLGYSDKEVEFLQLVGDRLFPVACDMAEDWDERLSFIPLISVAVYYDNIDQYPWPYQFFYRLLTGDCGEPGDPSLDNGPFDLAVFEDVDLDKVDWSAFVALCSEREEMSSLPALLQVASGSSDNLWVCMTPEDESYWQVEWGVEGMQDLADEWKEAEALFEQAAQASNWLERDPAQLEQVYALLRRAQGR